MTALAQQPIDPAVRIGHVHLKVADLERALAFYCGVLGFELTQRYGTQAAFVSAGGYHHHIGLNTWESRGGPPPPPGTTGLYHVAILYPTRAALADAARRLAAGGIPLDGASDHGVSEALYLSDPDGHGIEIYRDRPRREWPFVKGSLGMTTDPLDVRGLVAADRTRAPWEGIDPHTVMGHVHLHVADLAAAEHFYVDLLGLDLMQRFGGQAAFVSAGGYHHHLGLNTWAGIGAPPPPPTAARLLDFQLVVPNSMILTEIVDGLRISGIEVNATDEGWSVLDPSGNRILLNHLN